MKSYKEIIEEISNNTDISLEIVYDYVNSPMYDVFNSFFEFYYEALVRQKDFGIEPSLLFFNNYRSINASACLYNGYYIIQFNAGIIYYLVKKFKENHTLLIDTDNNEFIEFEKVLDVPINELMYQNASHFTFYHELAHLVQKSELLRDALYEIPSINRGYSQHSHLLELDADKFSSICIGTHVFQYLKGQFGKNLTKEQLEKTLILICSSALFYILSFNSNKLEIYYKENSHPQPVIRISYFVFHIVSYVKQSIDNSGFEVELNKKEIIKKCIQFSNKISLKKFNNRHIEDYVTILTEEGRNISNYIKEFELIQNQDESLASNKWNKRAAILKGK